MKKNIKKAFTLAETLLTLGIVGVIAALTIPSLKDFADEKILVTQVQKAYLIAKTATDSVEAKQGDLSLWNWGEVENEDPKCVPSDDNACATIEVKTIMEWYKSVMGAVPFQFTPYNVSFMNGTTWSLVRPSKWFITADGMYWLVQEHGGGVAFKGNYLKGVMHVDVNGPKGPNVVGIDVHAFTIGSEGVTPMGDNTHDNQSAWACTQYIIKHGNMPWYNDKNISSCDSYLGK